MPRLPAFTVTAISGWSDEQDATQLIEIHEQKLLSYSRPAEALRSFDATGQSRAVREKEKLAKPECD